MFDTNPSRCDYVLHRLTKEYRKNMLDRSERSRLVRTLKPHRHNLLHRLLFKLFPSMTCEVCKPTVSAAPGMQHAFRQK